RNIAAAVDRRHAGVRRIPGDRTTEILCRIVRIAAGGGELLRAAALQRGAVGTDGNHLQDRLTVSLASSLAARGSSRRRVLEVIYERVQCRFAHRSVPLNCVCLSWFLRLILPTYRTEQRS